MQQQQKWFDLYKTENKPPITVYRGEYNSNWEQWLLFTSDLHVDSINHRGDIFTKAMIEAKRKNAMVFLFGDIFDAMQSRNDKRRARAALKEKYQNREDYVDAIVEDLTEIFEPYKDNIAFMSYGNHETSLIKHLNTDILKRLIDNLNQNDGKIQLGEYGGYIKFRLSWKGFKGANKTFLIAYHHEGGSGNAPVTEGVIGVKRRMQWMSDFDIFVSGHNHKSWLMEQVREYVTEKDMIKRKIVSLLKTPSMKDKATTGYGWDVMNDFAPPVCGAYWVRLFPVLNKNNYEIAHQIMPVR